MTRADLRGLTGLALFFLACGADPPAPKPQLPATPTTDAKKDAKPDAPATPDQPFATPKLKPPPAPEGAVLLDPPLYVQRCDPDHKCPKLLMPAGETHCRELELGGHKGWRLPDRGEVKRFNHGDLAELEGFHWTRTAYADDNAQAWIVDPKSGQETTIPRDRKPFTIRCVLDP